MAKAPKRVTSKNAPAKTKTSHLARKTTPRETKRSQLIRMLKAKTGADIVQISKRLGWQHHTSRASLTRLRKAGFAIERSTNDGGGASVYRITAGPSADQAA